MKLVRIRAFFVCCCAVLVGYLPPIVVAEQMPFTTTILLDVVPIESSATLIVSLLPTTADGSCPKHHVFPRGSLFKKELGHLRPGIHLLVRGADQVFHKESTFSKPRQYCAQAFLDFDRGGRDFRNAAGNAASEPQQVLLGGDLRPRIDFVISKVNPKRRWAKSDRVIEVVRHSKLLSKHHGRPVDLRAAVVLPKSYSENTAGQFPVVYEIPGFGSSLSRTVSRILEAPSPTLESEFLYVVLESELRSGHHVFANSEFNGPWGDALVQELVPFIDRAYRTSGKTETRILRGHSSGGWSALWLQVQYPTTFGGAWATSPDPVDFRDFGGLNIYQPAANAYFDDGQHERPMFSLHGQVLWTFKSMSEMEEALGYGGQLGSFEAVFSPIAENGRPMQLWNRATGEINAEVAEYWKRYDIARILEHSWPEVKDALRGKLHIYVGGRDNIGLHRSVQLLKTRLKKLGSDAEIQILPQHDHFNILSPTVRTQIDNKIIEKMEKVARL